MLRPVNRCQSPTSTASPNAVSVDTPRRQHSRVTTGVHSRSAAIAAIALSSRSRRAAVEQHGLQRAVVGQLQRALGRSAGARSHCSCATVHAVPPE